MTNDLKTIDPKQAHLWIVGGGIAGMATAAFAIRDAKVPGENVHILEELDITGGNMDGAKSPVVPGTYVTRGGRMFEEQAYQTTWDLFSTIPSLEDPDVTVRQEVLDFNSTFTTHACARLVDAQHRILDASSYGLSNRDRLEMTRMLAMSEKTLGARRIDEIFGEHFFETSFWQMWRTMFAFQKWHSVIELRRYFLRFVQEFDLLDTVGGISRSRPKNSYTACMAPWIEYSTVNTTSPGSSVNCPRNAKFCAPSGITLGRSSGTRRANSADAYGIIEVVTSVVASTSCRMSSKPSWWMSSVRISVPVACDIFFAT